MTRITDPSSFHADWYGWLTNQAAHVLLGQITFAVMMIGSMGAGEFAHRLVVWVTVAVGYVIWEIATRSKLWDAVEDFMFVVIYGAGLPAMMFAEILPGSGMFMGSIWSVLPVIGLFCAHAALGVTLRLRAERGLR
jgi:hypothetical protein